jgi:hypothetical protein
VGEGVGGDDWGKAEVLYGSALGIGAGWIPGCDDFFAPLFPVCLVSFLQCGEGRGRGELG